MKDKEIEKSIANITEDMAFWGRYEKDIKVLLDLAKSVLNVEGLPEKKNLGIWTSWKKLESYNNKRGCRDFGFNECLDLCKVVIARDYVKRDEVEKMCLGCAGRFEAMINEKHKKQH